MSSISPSITAYTPSEYNQQIEAVDIVANRLHIDLGDGVFTTQTVHISDVWWPDGKTVDIHLMYQEPLKVLDEIVALRPSLVILQSEAIDVLEGIERIQSEDIRAGIAIPQSTSIESVAHLITLVDHVLIFSGTLGSFGGTADLSLLHKVPEVRVLNPDAEIGWDGGAAVDNVSQLSGGGVEVIVAGGAIQRADDPVKAFSELAGLL